MMTYYDQWLCYAVQWGDLETTFVKAREAVLALERQPSWFDWPDGSDLPDGPPEMRLVAIKRLLEADLAAIRTALDPEKDPEDAIRIMHGGLAMLVVLESNTYEPDNPLFISLERLFGAGLLKREGHNIYSRPRMIWTKTV